MDVSPYTQKILKGAIILLSAFMALEQLEIAQDIVLVFFIAVVGAAALAAGIAFGLGGREVAAQVTREWYERNRARPVRRGPPPVSPITTQTPTPTPGDPPFSPPPEDARE